MRPGGPPTEEPTSGRLVVIGNFDGVHLGHQAVLRSAAAEAEKRNLSLAVLTFEPHPAVVLGRKARAVLTLIDRKVQLLESVVPGLVVVVTEFTRALSLLSPREFAVQILRGQLDARAVLVGENFHFGNARAGDLRVLWELGQELGFDAWAEPLRGDEKGPYSSTRIRSLLAEGRVEEAAAILGRPHYLSGTVARGDQRGRVFGFPTANLEKTRQAIPKEGVYAVFVFEVGGERPRLLGPGVANIGARPTVGRPAALEVHLLDFSGDLYGKELGITLVARVRDVQKFVDVGALALQIAEDVKTARRLTGESAPALPL